MHAFIRERKNCLVATSKELRLSQPEVLCLKIDKRNGLSTVSPVFSRRRNEGNIRNFRFKNLPNSQACWLDKNRCGPAIALSSVPRKLSKSALALKRIML